MVRCLLRRGASPFGLLVASLLLASPALAQLQRPVPTVLRDVALTDGSRATLVLREGRIERVLGADAQVPPGYRVIEAAEFVALPGFVDAYSTAGCATPEPVKDQDVPLDVVSDVRVDMRAANRKGIQPAFRAADVVELGEDVAATWRGSGYGALLSSPSGRLLAGSSALATVRDGARRDVVMDAEVHAHAAFQAPGEGYPSTLMGYISQLRQFFHDARHHMVLEQRYAQGRPGLRPPYDAELEAARALLAGEETLVCEAQTARDVERWMDLAEEFGLRIAIAGGRDAWKVADRLAAHGIPVMLTLEWGEEVDDPAEEEDDAEPEAWEYVEPLGVRAERRRLWEEKRDCAIRLHEAGVTFAFGTAGARPKELLGNVRSVIEAGLPLEVARSGLTTGAARLVGAERRLGKIEPGYDATLTLWEADPLVDEKARPAWSFVDGFAYEHERKEKKEGGPPAEGEDASGTWPLAFSSGQGPDTAVLVLEMEENGAVEGTLTSTRRDEEVVVQVEGWLTGTELELEGEQRFGDASVSITLTAEIAGDELTGTQTRDLPARDRTSKRTFSATREPQGDEDVHEGHGYVDDGHPHSCHGETH